MLGRARHGSAQPGTARRGKEQLSDMAWLSGALVGKGIAGEVDARCGLVWCGPARHGFLHGEVGRDVLGQRTDGSG